jgi:hypothetical protein
VMNLQVLPHAILILVFRYHVFRVAGSNASDVWWGSSVEDLSTQIVSLIGKIQGKMISCFYLFTYL